MSALDHIMTPDKRPNALSWIIFGKPKVGKTTLACQWPKPLLIDIEGGTAFMAVPQLPLKQLIASGQDGVKVLQELWTALRDNPGQYETVIIDTADELFKVIAAPFKSNGVIPLQKYQLIYEKFTSIIESFKSLGVDVVMTAHEKQVVDEETGTILQTTVALPGKLAEDTGGRVDEIIYLTIKEVPIEGTENDEDRPMRQARYAVCHPTHSLKVGMISAGDRSGVLPPHIVDPDYQDLSAAKEATPRGLFDGKGDPTEENADVKDLFEGDK